MRVSVDEFAQMQRYALTFHCGISYLVILQSSIVVWFVQGFGTACTVLHLHALRYDPSPYWEFYGILTVGLASQPVWFYLSMRVVSHHVVGRNAASTSWNCLSIYKHLKSRLSFIFKSISALPFVFNFFLRTLTVQ